MGLPLIGVAVEIIKPLFIWVARIMETTKSPLSNAGSSVACTLHEFTDGFGISGDRSLSYWIAWAIRTDVGMARMFAGYERGSGWCTDCIAAVMVGESHATCSQSI